MKIPQGLKPAVWGAVVGTMQGLPSSASRRWDGRSAALPTGWQTSGQQSRSLPRLSPICVAKFEAQADVSKKLAQFKGVATSWDQSSFIENGGCGDHARERYAEFGRSPCMCGETRQRDLSGSEDNCRARYAGPS